MSENTLDAIVGCLEAEAYPQPPEITESGNADAKNPTSADQEEPSEATAATLSDPDTKRRLNRLDILRRQQLNLIRAEVEKHEKAVAKIGEAEAAIERATLDLRNARTELGIHFEQRDAALIHKRQHEDELRSINDEIRELNLTPAERRARDARREAECRRAEAAAAEAAAREAFENEMLPFEHMYVRVPGARRSIPDQWAIVGPGNRSIQVKRKDLPALQAEHAAAVAAIAKAERDDLADQYVAELRMNGRPWMFDNRAAEARWLVQWGPNSPRGRAYRERQLERGLSDADPPKWGTR
jgi:hypothetical protein